MFKSFIIAAEGQAANEPLANLHGNLLPGALEPIAAR
jgi:hypothetical protein